MLKKKRGNINNNYILCYVFKGIKTKEINDTYENNCIKNPVDVQLCPW